MKVGLREIPAVQEDATRHLCEKVDTHKCVMARVIGKSFFFYPSRFLTKKVGTLQIFHKTMKEVLLSL